MTSNLHPTIANALRGYMPTLGMRPQHPAKTRNTPTNVELIDAVCHYFAVSRWEAHGWLAGMDVDSASDELIDIDRAANRSMA